VARRRGREPSLQPDRVVARPPHGNVVGIASVRSEGDAELLARALSVEKGDSGFPFVVTSGPVWLADSFGEDEGPVLAIGDAEPDPSIVSRLNAVVFLAPDVCSGGPKLDSQPVAGSNCLGGGTVFATNSATRPMPTTTRVRRSHRGRCRSRRKTS
jgi:hypothetical protein